MPPVLVYEKCGQSGGRLQNLSKWSTSSCRTNGIILLMLQLYVIDGRQTVIRRVSRRVEQLSSWTYMTNEQKTFYYAECYLSVCTMQSRRKPEWGPQYPGEAHLERELWLSMGWINPRVRSRFFSFQWVGWVERAKSARLYFHENYIKSTKISSVA